MKEPVQLFKALADETRLRILALLLREEELCVCNIIAALSLPQSTISRHLAYLRRAGLVNDRRCGLWMYYSIAEMKGEFQPAVLALLRERLPALQTAAADTLSLAECSKTRDCG